jgi:hypothetical protein
LLSGATVHILGHSVCFLGQRRRHPRVDRGARVKSLRSHLSAVDLTQLAYDGATPTGRSLAALLDRLDQQH